ncbi:hypothetical protein EVAR_4125_1 [Eumeta japonica]|uniref:Uncharacterized protein n=1 Tax=Eumeta variegata TaxID=151549 RepID=A0A4C1ZZM7_EUMVA|nr:hypothetical protein EVAR_4125_1 [Eumeta japonica]
MLYYSVIKCMQPELQRSYHVEICSLCLPYWEIGAGNALVTPLGFRVSMSDGEHLLSDSSPARLSLKYAIKKPSKRHLQPQKNYQCMSDLAERKNISDGRKTDEGKVG